MRKIEQEGKEGLAPSIYRRRDSMEVEHMHSTRAVGRHERERGNNQEGMRHIEQVRSRRGSGLSRKRDA
jgi:hypothetical protein